ncbi:MAG: ribonuclease P protein component [Bacilli bacterium]|nr:ribonuclease P protein component [Bacilli bacterium]
MKKTNILKENKDFKRIMNLNNCYKNKYYLIFIEKNEVIVNHHFGISVSKKLGNAVVRNKLKRQIKSIIDEKTYQNNFNCIIILRKDILNASFEEKKENLYNLLMKVNIIKGDKNEE